MAEEEINSKFKAQKSKLQSQFTQKEWAEEMAKIKFCGQHAGFGSCNLPCPSCGVIGFYSPRGKSDDSGNIPRKYRACKFCGFWQEAFGEIYNQKGGKPYRCVMVQCNDCRVYSWRVPWSDDWRQCEKCGSKDLKEVKWPTEDLSHIFHKIKKQIQNIHSFRN